MTKRLFVGGLPWNLTDTQLVNYFAKIIIDKFTQRSKDFGFVEYAKNTDAEKAIQKLNGFETRGRRIIVQKARPLEEKISRRDFRGSGRNDQRNNKR